MRKLALTLALVFVLAATALIVACNIVPYAVENISIYVIDADGTKLVEISNKNFESNIVRDILLAANDQLQIPESELESGFIDTVAGIKTDWETDNKFWAFEINGEFSMLGIAQATVSNGDTITFTKTEGF